MTPPVRAFICGCEGLALSAAETAFLRDNAPWGLILFRRNIESPGQVAALVAAYRDIMQRPDAPVFVDQEGGRVQRLGPPHWRKFPPAAIFAKLAGEAERAAALGARLIAHDLATLGITGDCLPVLDVPSAGAHDIIGDRAYAATPDRVAALGRAAAEALMAGGVLPVIKHIPGHGRAAADSHLELPVVHTERAVLEAHDFAPFRALADMPIAMTAHVVYAAIDAKRPATTSPIVVTDVIRGAIGFDGLLMSDDLSMKALSGSFAERTETAFAAGMDVVLHCNGDLAEARAIAAVTPVLAGRAQDRAEAALARIAPGPDALNVVDAGRDFDRLLAMVA